MAKTKTFDAIIIGAGVIGNALALELTRLGHKTISVDALPGAGYGSIPNSCAIIRLHYSTLGGTAFTYAPYFYWKRWSDYLGHRQVDNLASFRQTGCLAMKTVGNNHDSQPLSFTLCHIDFVLDTATMFRLRTINTESSFSVLD